MDNVMFFINGCRIINGSKVLKITQVDNEILFDIDKGLFNPSVTFANSERAKSFMEKMVETLSKAPRNHRFIIKINEDDLGTEKDDKEGEDK